MEILAIMSNKFQWYFCDLLVTYQQSNDPLLSDCQAIDCSGQLLVKTHLRLNWYSTDTWPMCRPRWQPMYWLTPPVRHMIWAFNKSTNNNYYYIEDTSSISSWHACCSCLWLRGRSYLLICLQFVLAICKSGCDPNHGSCTVPYTCV